MNSQDMLKDAFGRVEDAVPGLVNGLTSAALLWRPGAQANPIAWLVWHISRCLDNQLAAITDQPQAWDQGWSDRFSLPYEHEDGGYGQTPEQVAAFGVSDPELLLGYFNAAAARYKTVLDTITEQDLDKVIDTNWNPPVTAGVRLVSIINDITQHLGQAAYVRGLWESQQNA